MARGQHKPPRIKSKKLPSSPRAKLNQSVQLVHQVCCLAGSHSLIEEIRSSGTPNTLGSFIERRDTPALFDRLIDVLSLQGISDRVATDYIEAHGNITWREIEHQLSKRPSCPKLKSYWNFGCGCGYSKSKKTCAHPEHYARCPLPKHRLRNGRLNQTAYSLYFFLRDITDSDLVNWIDGRLSNVISMRLGGPTYLAAMRESLLGPLRHVYGVADKTLSLAFASILLAAQDARTHWHEVGGSMIAIDTLVHKFLSRTGIIAKIGVEHPYGESCYEENGCASVIQAIAKRIDARHFNKSFPRVFPRYVQFALWRYCALDALNICNSNRIDDQERCQLRWCRLFAQCARYPVA
jgi:hypothetical protein